MIWATVMTPPLAGLASAAVGPGWVWFGAPAGGVHKMKDSSSPIVVAPELSAKLPGRKRTVTSPAGSGAARV